MSTIEQLRSLVSALGQAGGCSSPSIYDTAQAVRLLPGAAPAQGERLAFLRSQQAKDGGFGAGPALLAREVATLATLLALRAAAQRGDGEPADMQRLEAAEAFLRGQQGGATVDGVLPSAAELILSNLLEAAEMPGVAPLLGPGYAALRRSGERRRSLVRAARRTGLQHEKATPLLHSFELWGDERAEPQALYDGSGGVGHSPAATCALLAQHPQQAAAWGYLERASAALGEGSGILPTGYPLDRFEQSFALYALLINDLLLLPELAPVVAPQAEQLRQALSGEGLGCSDYFVADVDDSAAAVAVLAAWQRGAGQALDPAWRAQAVALLRRFLRGDRFLTWEGETLCAPSANARAVHALALLGEDEPAVRGFLRAAQRTDGLWDGDKWHCAPLYVTLHVVLALRPDDAADAAAVAAAATGVLAAQRPDGSFSADGQTALPASAAHLQTAFAATLLGHLLRGPRFHGLPPHDVLEGALRRALGALDSASETSQTAPLWLAKQVYAMPRVDGALVASARLGSERLLGGMRGVSLVGAPHGGE